jgi:ABC-2 type transport system ATP-binding protein
MTTPLAVEVHNLSKRFRLYHEKVNSMKERLLRAGRNPYEDFWALQDLSFAVPEGGTLGILGRNGSGKSTLLKCISGILQPTDGKVIVRGQLAALLELGAGFQPELSGRDNIFLNASLLGLSTKEIERRFDEIVGFAELEQFIDNQVKYYSSGMYVRLGFSVAVSVEPDVLVVDEVLAVGDENFARKCLERIKQFQSEGRTILFVTHAPDLVRQICDHALVLNEGRLVGQGQPGETIRVFRELLLESGSPHEQDLLAGTGTDRLEDVRTRHEKAVRFTGVEVEHPGVGARPYLLPGEPLAVKVAFDAGQPVSDLVFGIEIHNQAGELVFATDTEILGVHFDAPMGSGRVDFSFDAIPLSDGTFNVGFRALSLSGGVVYDIRDQDQFEVMNPGRSTGVVYLTARAEIRVSSIPDLGVPRAGMETTG